MIELKLNLSDIPKDKIFEGQKGKYLDICVVKMQKPDAYNNTHTMYVKTKSKDETKIYIGKGIGKFEDAVSVPQPANTPTYDPNNNGGVDDLPF